MRTFFKIPRSYALIYLAGLAVMGVIGCNGEDHHKAVDFSKTIVVPSPNFEPRTSRHLKVAVAAMISPKETLIYYKELLAYLAGRLGYDVRLIQRRTYREVNELFLKRQLDLAFICTGPYVAGRQLYGFEGLATPVIRGRPYYQSYLIVNRHSAIENLEQLRGKTFAFTDPDSNTGSLVPRYWLAMMDESPSSFFGNSIYTYSHDNSIMAVARSLVDAAAVDGHQWEYFNLRNPQYTRMTRVIRKSELFGNPPLVASVDLAAELKTAIRNALLTMHEDPQGKRILDQLLIEANCSDMKKALSPVRCVEKPVVSNRPMGARSFWMKSVRSRPPPKSNCCGFCRASNSSGWEEKPALPSMSAFWRPPTAISCRRCRPANSAKTCITDST